MRRFVLLLTMMAATSVAASRVALTVNEIGTNGPDSLKGTNGDDSLLGWAATTRSSALAGGTT
jgi:hypothetical protein